MSPENWYWFVPAASTCLGSAAWARCHPPLVQKWGWGSSGGTSFIKYRGRSGADAWLGSNREGKLRHGLVACRGAQCRALPWPPAMGLPGWGGCHRHGTAA